MASVYCTGCNRHNRVKPLHLINNYPLIINVSLSKGRGDGPLQAWRWIMHRVLVKRADPHSTNYPGVITSLRNPTPLYTHTHSLQHLRVTAAVYLGLISLSRLCYFLDFPAVFRKERTPDLSRWFWITNQSQVPSVAPPRSLRLSEVMRRDWRTAGGLA